VQLAQVLEALVQEAESVQKHKPQLHALYLQDAPAALADACSSTPGAASLASGVDLQHATLATPQVVEQALAGSSAAALSMINTASTTSSSVAGGPASMAGRMAEPMTPSSGGGGGLFGGGGGKLLDALLGRKNSAGVGEVDRVMALSSSRRASQECSRAATPQHSNAPAGIGLHGLSRTVSDAAAPGASSRQLGCCCSSRCQTPCGGQGTLPASACNSGRWQHC
jgi:cell division septum initiation protein DivIVA